MDENDKLEKIEEILNMTFPGLSMLYRDANLGALGDLYSAGLIIRERGFTDASNRGGNLVTTHRFAILSNHYLDAASFEHGTHWGLCIMERGSYYKVLDVYHQQEKTQITLLHLPGQHWQFFENISTNLDEQVVETARKRFDEHLSTVPIAELAQDDWLQRCRFPLGMDDNGALFPLMENNIEQTDQ